MSYLDLEIIYDIEADKFSFDGDVKPEKRADLIMEFVRSQIGTGEDTNPANEVSVYKISLRWFPNGDRFAVTHNCGNKGLREGILMEAAKRIRAGVQA